MNLRRRALLLLMLPLMLLVLLVPLMSGENRMASLNNAYWSLMSLLPTISLCMSSLILTLEMMDCHVFKKSESSNTWSDKKVSGRSSWERWTAWLFNVMNDVINAGSFGVESTRFTLFDFTSSNSSFVKPVLYMRSMYIWSDGPFFVVTVSLFAGSGVPHFFFTVSLFVERVSRLERTGLSWIAYFVSGFFLGFSNGVK